MKTAPTLIGSLLLAGTLAACGGGAAAPSSAAPASVAAKPSTAAVASSAAAKPATSSAAAKPSAATSAAAKPAASGAASAKPAASGASAKPAASGSAAAKPAAAPSVPASVTLTVATNATLGKILADDKNRTLYTFDRDTTADQSACTGGCATTWPPLYSNAAPTAPAGFTGTFKLFTRSDNNAKQVEANNKPLYYYAPDQPGDAKGDGLNGIWHVVKAS